MSPMLARLTRFAWALAIGVLAAAGSARAESQTVVLVPAFTGDLDQGRGASYVLKLALQVGQHQKDSLPGCAGEVGAVARGAVLWVPGQLADATPEDARRLGVLNGAQAVLWGAVSTYPDGALVSPFLTLVDDDTDLREARPERVRVATTAGEFTLGHPATTLSFEPIQIANSALQRFSYSNLKICDDSRACVDLGHTYRIIRVLGIDGDAIRLRYQSKDYNLSARSLTSSRSTITVYVDALTALLKGQNNRAACGFRTLANDEDQTSGVRQSALYYLGLLDLRAGRCPFSAFQMAFKQNEASEVVARSLLIADQASVCRARRLALRTPDAIDALAIARSIVRVGLAEKPDRQMQALLGSAR